MPQSRAAEGDLSEAPYAPQQTIALGEQERVVSERLNQFAWQLFAKAMQQSDKPSLMTSPLSLIEDLMMLSNGLQGATLEEVLQATGLAGCTMEQIDQYFVRLNEGLFQADPRTRFRTDCSVWYHAGMLQMLPQFAQLVKENFKAEIFPVAMDESTLHAVNQWTDERTYGRIPQLMTEMNKDTYALLINTVYFRGLWPGEVSMRPVTPGKFTALDGTTHEAMMVAYSQVDAPYLQGEAF